MKQDILLLGGIILICIATVIVTNISVTYISEETCLIRTVSVLIEGGYTEVVMTVKPSDEIVQLVDSGPTPKFDPGDYETGRMFRCSVHSLRKTGFKTISLFDNIKNTSENAHVRDNTYNGLVIIYSIFASLIALGCLARLISMIRTGDKPDNYPIQATHLTPV